MFFQISQLDGSQDDANSHAIMHIGDETGSGCHLSGASTSRSSPAKKINAIMHTGYETGSGCLVSGASTSCSSPTKKIEIEVNTS